MGVLGIAVVVVVVGCLFDSVDNEPNEFESVRSLK